MKTKTAVYLAVFLVLNLGLVVAESAIDTDNDGLLDTYEAIYKTDPAKPDTDGGGVGDGAEVLIDGTNPLSRADDNNQDQDGDTLSDSEDVILGSSASLADTDNDGLSDYEELIYKTKAIAKDTDFDGLSDFKEVKETGTDPNMFDTDQDGVSDGTEILVDGTDPKDAGSNIKKDTDLDGLTDSDEARIGTAINNPDTDGDGFKDGAEILAGYSPLGEGRLVNMAQAIDLGPRTAGKISELYTIDTVETTSNSMVISGTGPKGIMLTLFVYSNQNEPITKIIEVDATGVWGTTLTDLELGDYDLYITLLGKDNRVLVKSLKKMVSLTAPAPIDDQGGLIIENDLEADSSNVNSYLLAGVLIFIGLGLALLALWFIKRKRGIVPDDKKAIIDENEAPSPEVRSGPIVKPLSDLEGFSGNSKTGAGPESLPTQTSESVVAQESVEQPESNPESIPPAPKPEPQPAPKNTQDIKGDKTQTSEQEKSTNIPNNLPIDESSDIDNLKDRIK